MNFAFDIDGTITAAPAVYGAVMRALRAAGHRVFVLTGTGDRQVRHMHTVERVIQLQGLGIESDAYDELVVFAPHSEGWACKADWCANHDVVLLVEDSMEYVEPALDQGITCLVVP